ncbi:MAG: hypothetical protein HQL52_08085 [Magnetococcales bacterium]|nr:hypothetical protein [Magnetococcales bacterium]
MQTIQLSQDMEEMFQTLAKETGRPLKELIHEALDRFLHEWEDQQDAEESERLYREYMESGEPGIPWEQVKADMDLKHGL